PPVSRSKYSSWRWNSRSRSALKARERTNPTKFRSVGLLSFFAPDAERFLGRAVGDREQHGFLRRPVGVTLPWRHDKDVIWPPFQDRAVDLGRAVALDADENRAVGRTVRCAFKTLRQHRQLRAHGGQHR